jgi:hypothetical protein
MRWVNQRHNVNWTTGPLCPSKQTCFTLAEIGRSYNVSHSTISRLG